MSDAKDMTMATFASSDGWKRMPATVIQRLAPCDASPDERLEIATVPKFWKLLTEVLKTI